MILTCPECTTRYRFEESRIPQGGLAVRCKRCRTVFTAHNPGMRVASAPRPAPAAAPARPHLAHGAAPVSSRAAAAPHTDGASGQPKASNAAARGGRAAFEPSPSVLRPVPAPSAAIPVTVIPPPSAPAEEEIRRLTRIIVSDIVIYSPEKAERSIREGRFPDLYRAEIEEGRKMIRSRFPSAGAAVETYDRCLKDLIETRRKELQESAEAL